MTSKPRLLLLDGDVFCFVAAAAAQKDVKYPEDNVVVRWADEDEGKSILDAMVAQIKDRLGTGEYLFFLTDPNDNWRFQVYPEYKGNRSDQERPQLLTDLKSYSRTKHSALSWEGFEADDLMGIWATNPEILAEWDPVIVSKDKDMKGIPGKFFNLNRLADPSYTVETISEEAADRWHLVQTLAGDKVDNYPGCPGIGIDRAEQILDAGLALRPDHGFITRGKNKGQRTTKWMSFPCDDPWRIVVTHYEKAGEDEEKALTMARVARICRYSDIDPEDNNSVILWEPYSE